MPLKLNEMTPKGGAALLLGNLTVLVGPNNAGKSQMLRDIRDYIVSGSTQQLTIADSLEVALPVQTEAIAALSFLPHTSPGHTRILGVGSDLQNRHEFSPHGDWIKQHFAQEGQASARAELLRNMGQYWCAFLDAESRFRLAAPAESYDTRSEAPSNALQEFFSGGSPVVEELRKAFKDTFSMDIALDWAAMRRLYLKVGAEFGTIPDTRTQLDALLKDAQQLSQQGDGYRSFAGIALAVLAFPNRLLMIDEPEAFLHPAQTRSLGRWIAGKAKDRAAQVILASHSADFLLGVISADADATVIRLNRSDRGTTFHKIPSGTTAGLINSPLLSSQPVLDALFHKGVVVCEGDCVFQRS
jgi:ABC-type branched-subunit amino acid transport system ATPase component